MFKLFKKDPRLAHNKILHMGIEVAKLKNTNRELTERNDYLVYRLADMCSPLIDINKNTILTQKES